jgi:hypothetical protein
MKYILFLLLGFSLSGCSNIPAEYVGSWGNDDTRLTIMESGDLNYIHREASILGGQSTSVSKWSIRKITNEEISGVMPFSSIAIEGPPERDENGLMFLSVEDKKLYRIIYKAPPRDESNGLVDKILHTEFCKAIPSPWTHSDCE